MLYAQHGKEHTPVLFLKVLTCQAPQQADAFPVILEHLFQELTDRIDGLYPLGFLNVILHNINIFVKAFAEDYPLLSKELLNLIAIVNEEKPVTHLPF